MPLHVPDNTPRGTHDCRLEYVSPTEIRLVPFGGNQMMCGGIRYTIPAAGISMAPPTNLLTNAYYIYVYPNPGTTTLALTYGTQVPVLDPWGMPTNTAPGWTANTLVGYVVGGAATFQHGGSIIGVVSYWNRKRVQAAAYVSGSTSSNSAVELNSGNRLWWGSFAGDHVRAMVSGTMYGDSVMAAICQIVWNGSGIGHAAYSVIPTATAVENLSLNFELRDLAAGTHSAAFFAWVGSGVGTFYPLCSVIAEG